MQTQPDRSRYRGVRESRRLVEFTKSLACDLAEVLDAQDVNVGLLAALEPNLVLFREDQVAALLHCRTQIRYRLTNRS